MRLRTRMALERATPVMPTSRLRVALLRGVFKYRIRDCTVGWRTLVVVDEADLVGCSLGRGNALVGPMSVRIGRGARVGQDNEFICGWWVKGPEHESGGYGRELVIGEDCLVTSKHYFDVAGRLTLGNRSWVGGRGSQFWTHGAGIQERDIHIGSDCYLGSAVRFAPGSGVGDGTLVGMGSVVAGSFSERQVVLAGHPARVVRSDAAVRRVGEQRAD